MNLCPQHRCGSARLIIFEPLYYSVSSTQHLSSLAIVQPKEPLPGREIFVFHCRDPSFSFLARAICLCRSVWSSLSLGNPSFQILAYSTTYSCGSRCSCSWITIPRTHHLLKKRKKKKPQFNHLLSAEHNTVKYVANKETENLHFPHHQLSSHLHPSHALHLAPYKDWQILSHLLSLSLPAESVGSYILNAAKQLFMTECWFWGPRDNPLKKRYNNSIYAND